MRIEWACVLMAGAARAHWPESPNPGIRGRKRVAIVALSEIDRNLLTRCLGSAAGRGKILSIGSWGW